MSEVAAEPICPRFSDIPDSSQDASGRARRLPRHAVPAVVVVLLLALALPAAAAATGVVAELALRGVGRALVATGHVPAEIDAAAVLGGGSVDMSRELAAVRLYADGRTRTVVALGGPLPCCDPDRSYANAVHRRLLGLGIPAADVITIHQGASTIAELRALRRLAEERGWRHVAIATSDWHSRRASLEASRAFAGSSVAWTVTALDGGDLDLANWWRDPVSRRYVIGEFAKIALIPLRSR